LCGFGDLTGPFLYRTVIQKKKIPVITCYIISTVYFSIPKT